MASSLPDNPSLESLRAEAVAMARAQGWAVQRAEHSVALGHGFSGWAALLHYLDVAAELSRDPAAVDVTRLGVADRFCFLAVLHYTASDAPRRFAAAAQLLRAEPGLVDTHVWAAAAAADPEAVSRSLRQDRSGANALGGPFGWPALLYLCYGRAPRNRGEDDVIGCATALLDSGADPDAGYLWRGMATPFTALTGVFGEGEQGPRRQPRHPYAPALATLLLDRGAHPVDQQTLYNRMFQADNSHLHLLFDRGLATAGASPWERRLGEAMETRTQMWHRQLDWAAEHGFGARLELLARHGVRR